MNMFKKLILSFALCFCVFGNVKNVEAKVVKDIKVSGNERYNSGMIIASLPFEIGDDINSVDLNKALKIMFKTKLFEDVSISQKGSVVLVKVSEAVMVKKYYIEGNDDVSEDILRDNITLKDMSPFSESEISKNVKNMLDVLNAYGFYSAKVNPVKIKVSDSVYNVVFEIEEGPKAKIEKVLFTGNKFFSDRELKAQVSTQEYKWWKFFSQSDVFDESRAKRDVSLLERFYKNNGFVDVKIVPTNVDVSKDKSSFILTFDVAEGDRYKISDVSIKSDAVIFDLDSLLVKDSLTIENDWFSLDMKNKTEAALALSLENEGFTFKEVSSSVQKVDGANKPSLKIVYEVKEGKKLFVNKINILGNTVTRDSVIRNELYIGERDTLTQTKLRVSKGELSNTGYFDAVDIATLPTMNPEKVDLNVSVMERNTGEIAFSLGWSTLNGVLLDLAYNESNFMGKGHKVGINASTSTLTDRASFSYTDPYFFNKNMSGGASIFFNNYKYQEDYGYDMISYGFSLNTGWKYNRKLSQSLKFMYKRDDVFDLADDSYISPEDAGEATLYLLNQRLNWSDTDYNLLHKTRSGYTVSLSNDYTLDFSTENYLKTDLSAKFYRSFFNDRVSTSFTVNGGYVEALKDDYLKGSYRYFLGGSTLRGFSISGVGARKFDTSGNYSTYTEGGMWRVYGSFESKFPLGLPKDYQIFGLAFFDFGAIGEPSGFNNTDTSYDDKIRTSIGTGIHWDSPMGAIALTWAWAQQYEEYDEREVFRLSVGNQF